ncbi:MAG: tetratricopeptide repeat protein [Candidatus Krumholzibacteriia bacterium]
MEATSRHAQDSTLESQALYNLALERMARNNYRKALDFLVRSLQISPGNALYLSYFGFCLAQVNRDYDRAVRHCKQAVNAMPSNPIPYVNLGKVYRLRGDNGSAYEVLQRAWAINRKHPATASELTRMGIRRRPFIPFLPRANWCNKYLGKLRANLERRLVGQRQS